jgi:hypothetical protein
LTLKVTVQVPAGTEILDPPGVPFLLEEPVAPQFNFQSLLVRNLASPAPKSKVIVAIFGFFGSEIFILVVELNDLTFRGSDPAKKSVGGKKWLSGVGDWFDKELFFNLFYSVALFYIKKTVELIIPSPRWPQFSAIKILQCHLIKSDIIALFVVVGFDFELDVDGEAGGGPLR